jgi:ubiquinone/menaquinone biosynthesis C-methylase UbiE
MTDSESYRGRLQSHDSAQGYASRFERGPRRRIDAREQGAVSRIFDTLPECRSVLDVPSGAGRFLATLARNGREVIAMDVAVEILAFARERADRLGLKAQFLQGDAAKTGLPDARVDAVFCNRLLHHITSAPERAVFLREFYRVSRRSLVVSFFDYRAFDGVRVFLKKLKGRKVDYTGQPTLAEFTEETARCGFRLLRVVPTGPFWVSEKYFVLEKSGPPGGPTAR